MSARKPARTAEVLSLSHDARRAVIRQYPTRWTFQTMCAVLGYPDVYRATLEEWADLFDEVQTALDAAEKKWLDPQRQKLQALPPGILGFKEEAARIKARRAAERRESP